MIWGILFLQNTRALIDSGKATEAQIDRMVKSILRTCVAMGFYDRPAQDLSFIAKFVEHQQVALDVARQGIVLLKNEGQILPIPRDKQLKIVATGKYLQQLAHGRGSAYVDGYDNISLAQALKDEFGQHLEIVATTDTGKISAADIVLLSTGTFDSEGSDRPFGLPDEELLTINRVLQKSKRAVVIVNSGSGINMSPWVDQASAIVYAWYGGQTGNKALAEILTGKVNPSGKLPISIEKSFEDSPGYGYLPVDEVLYTGNPPDNFTHREYDIPYREGIFVGYRWYEHKKIVPLFAFGHGLSYSTFDYRDLKITPVSFSRDENVTLTFTIENTGLVDGAEIARVYVQDIESSQPRPVKELKGFEKVFLKAGEKKEIKIILNQEAFCYWDPDRNQWYAESGKFRILIGSASNKIRLEQEIYLL